MHPILGSFPRSLKPVLLVGAIGLSLTATAAPATAHDRLVNTTPAAGATIATPPASLGLTFSAAIIPVGTQVVVKDPAGVNRAASSTVTGSKVTTALRPGGAAGRYQVTWRAVSKDGHPISGTYSFTTQRAAAAPTSATTTAAATSSTATSSAAAPATTSTTSATQEKAPSWRPWALSLPIVALAAIAVAMLRRRGRR